MRRLPILMEGSLPARHQLRMVSAGTPVARHICWAVPAGGCLIAGSSVSSSRRAWLMVSSTALEPSCPVCMCHHTWESAHMHPARWSCWWASHPAMPCTVGTGLPYSPPVSALTCLQVVRRTVSMVILRSSHVIDSGGLERGRLGALYASVWLPRAGSNCWSSSGANRLIVESACRYLSASICSNVAYIFPASRWFIPSILA